MYQTVQNTICNGPLLHGLVPRRERELRSDHQRRDPHPVIYDIEQLSCTIYRYGSQSPVVNDHYVYTVELGHKGSVTTIQASGSNTLQQGRALEVANRSAGTYCSYAKGTTEIRLTNACRALRSKSPEMVTQEIYTRLLVYFAIRTLINRAVEPSELDPDRVSFTASLRVVRRLVTDQAAFFP